MGHFEWPPGSHAVGWKTSTFFRNEAEYLELSQKALPQLASGVPFHHELLLKRQDGVELWVQIIGYLSDSTDPGKGSWWLIQDRTEFRRAQVDLETNYERLKETNHRLEEAQNQLLQSEKMASLGQLAAGVAHEINNPIGFVSSNLHSLNRHVEAILGLLVDYEKREPELCAESRTILAKSKRVAELDYILEDLPVLLKESADGLGRVKRIVQDLKDFSRVDNADWVDADLNAGLDSTLNVIYHEVKYKAEVVKRYAQLPVVRCLAGQLNQVFLNLIVNAAQAIDKHGRITLSTGVSGPFVWVEVQDNGCGMSKQVQARIFEPFYTTKPVGKGTGLGLSLSLSIVKTHGGFINVRSVVGEGTAFRVWIPIDASHSNAAAAPPAEWA